MGKQEVLEVSQKGGKGNGSRSSLLSPQTFRTSSQVPPLSLSAAEHGTFPHVKLRKDDTPVWALQYSDGNVFIQLAMCKTEDSESAENNQLVVNCTSSDGHEPAAVSQYTR
ncbi:hypothetical protein AV530_010994 [Patagioenas fasciata monilis]|uniref:Uncharacterized protein n=1 Tax=Patagioenas fasciata monilis TaxID=372326 RepID=A0A1V4K357_PATFA|nr:hypothetical protein AV530_010994 [Patagioenas fasciata monilis]